MHKVLIANRGEIAVRIIRACKELGLQTVAVYSEADKEALHVLHADEAVCIGEAPARKSYLKVSNLLSACEITQADAIHPGYGFLSENPNFAAICESCGINFIGPSSKSISLLGDKAKAKALAWRSGCPVIPGSEGVVETLQEGLDAASRIGYPLLIKAAAGGGGKGIRISRSKEDFARQFSSARAEAEVSFGRPDVYLEKLLFNPRHVEVQILGDKRGNYIHLGERDCTIQRRKQKLVEEAPSPVLTPKIRSRIGKAAIRAVAGAGYYSAGTVEFLVDSRLNFYFMEVNTRIQVEHPVTEELTGVDLVKEQLRIAQGERLSLRQKEVQIEGHVMEFRINAENPSANFAPSPGRLEYYLPPGGPGVRIDSACYSGYYIPPHYDSMIAKLIVKGRDRREAISIAKRALEEYHIGGIETNIGFHRYLLEDPHFLSSDYDIGYIDRRVEEGKEVAKAGSV